MLKVLITSPSLSANSGISSFVNSVLGKVDNVCYRHCEIGKSDTKDSRFRLFFQIVNFVKKLRSVDVLHINACMDYQSLIRDLFLVFIARFMGKKVVAHFHGGKFCRNLSSGFGVHFLFNLFLFFSKKIIFLCRDEALLAGVSDHKKVFIVPNGVSLSSIKKQRSFNRKRLTIIYIGRLDIQKGILDSLEAMSLAMDKFDSLHFMIYGSGPDIGLIQKRIDELCLSNTVLCGVVQGAKKADVLKRADIFLMPSYFEGMPFSLLETMAFGVVPIVTPVGSMGDIVSNGYNGFLVPMNSPHDIYLSLKSALMDPDNFSYLSSNAYKTIENSFSINKTVALLNDIYT